MDQVNKFCLGIQQKQARSHTKRFDEGISAKNDELIKSNSVIPTQHKQILNFHLL